MSRLGLYSNGTRDSFSLRTTVYRNALLNGTSDSSADSTLCNMTSGGSSWEKFSSKFKKNVSIWSSWSSFA